MIKPHKLITSPQNFICLATVLKRINEFIDYPVFREVTPSIAEKVGKRHFPAFSLSLDAVPSSEKAH